MASDRKQLSTAIGLISLFILVIALHSIYRRLYPYLDREIMGPVTVFTEWLEITPKKPLVPERRIHEIFLKSAGGYEPDYKGWGLRLPDGTVLTPEVQLVDQYGGVYQLKFGVLDETGISFTFRDPVSHEEILPTDRTYRAVRIRSSKPIKFSRVVWRCYNPWDFK